MRFPSPDAVVSHAISGRRPRLFRRSRLKPLVSPLVVTILAGSLPQAVWAGPVDGARPAAAAAGGAVLDGGSGAQPTPNRTLPKVSPPSATPRFSAAPTDAELSAVQVFDEPLAPLGGAGRAEENAALAAAIQKQAGADRSRDAAPFGGFEEFLQAHPGSAWAPSILAGLGVAYRRIGYYGRALAADERAWQATKSDSSPAARAIAFRALGELLELKSRLGRTDDVQALISDAEGLDLSGPITERVEQARQALWLMLNEPGDSFRCGPLALEKVLTQNTPDQEVPAIVAALKSTSRGTALSQLRDVAQQAGVRMDGIRRAPGAPVPVPSVVHWKVGHFAAVVRESAGRYLVVDPTFVDEVWVTPATLDEEASGAFLTPTRRLETGWSPLTEYDLASTWGKGGPGGQDPQYQGPKCECPGLAGYGIQESLGALTISDTPVSYAPARGPSLSFRVTYNQRDVFQPQVFTYSNVGPKWTFDWLSYVEDDPANPAQAVKIYLRGGGQETYNSYDPTTMAYAPQLRSRARLVRTATSPIRYERRLTDGSIEVFSQPVAGASVPRKVLLTGLVDSQGDALTFVYDGLLRLVALVDATGQATTVAYENANDRLKISRVTDPLGRSARFDYDSSGRLTKITDVVGLTSEFSYGSSDFVTSLTTPYGTTRFDWGVSGAERWLQVTDPGGGVERVETWLTNNAYPSPDPTAPPNVLNDVHSQRKALTLRWDKRAMATAPGAIESAEVTHWLWNTLVSGIPRARKKPLENRVWYLYPGQSLGNPSHYVGTSAQPSRVTRLLDDGTEQRWSYDYNQSGKVIKSTDPLGRVTLSVYGTGSTPDSDQAAGLGLDLLQTKQLRDPNAKTPAWDVLSSTTYDSHHQPLTVTDAANQSTTYTYDGLSRLATIVTPPRNGPNGVPLTQAERTTTYEYYPENAAGGVGRLMRITGPASAAGPPITQYAYDAYGRLATVTAPDGRQVTQTYDSLDRLVRTTYMDGTWEETTYDKLDAVAQRDRLGRWTHTFYDAMRRPTSVRDALGRTTTSFWCGCGSLDRLVDANGNETRWERDVQGRVTRETRADGASTEFTYEATTSRLKERKDARGQVAHMTYYRDDSLAQKSYTGTFADTPTVSYTYDPGYRRVATMTDGTGLTTYSYFPVNGALGSGQLATVEGPLANDAITYTYDELGRVKSRTLVGTTHASTYAYDSLGRLATQTTHFGAFPYEYVGVTGRLSRLTYPSGQRTDYAYQPVAADSYLQEIRHLGPGGSPMLSQFNYTYDAIGNIKTWRQQVTSLAAPQNDTQFDYGYDAADQLQWATQRTPGGTVLKRYGYAYDPAGNRTAEQIDDATTEALVNSRNQVTRTQPGGALLFRGTTNEPAVVTVQGRAARVGDPATTFEGQATVATNTNSVVTVTAKDGAGNVATKQYSVSEPGSPQTTYDYYATGELRTDGTRNYQFDGEGRLVRVADGSNVEIARFAYDGLGRRAQKTAGGITRTYVYDGSSLVEERASNGVTLRFYDGPGIDQHLAQYAAGGSAVYLLADHLGSVWQQTNSSGAVTFTRQYDPWGNMSAGASASRYAYTGREWDPETGWYYYRARYYDPRLGRFVSEDGDPNAGARNLYVYVESRPILQADPAGMKADLNLFSKRQQPTEHEAAESAASIEGYFTVFAHGNTTGLGNVVRDENLVWLSAEALAKRIQKTGGCGQKVFLFACNAGKEAYAQELANRLKCEVKAPDGLVNFWKEYRPWGVSPLGDTRYRSFRPE